MNKSLEEMTTEETVDYLTGRLIMAIGRGDFRQEVSLWVMALKTESYDRGFKAAQKQRRKK
jgi:hypothetical protein